MVFMHYRKVIDISAKAVFAVSDRMGPLHLRFSLPALNSPIKRDRSSGEYPAIKELTRDPERKTHARSNPDFDQ